MKELERSLKHAMNQVWMKSHGKGSTFSLPHAGKDVVSLVSELDSLGYVEDLLDVPGKDPGVNGKITEKGREYCQEHFGNPPIDPRSS